MLGDRSPRRRISLPAEPTSEPCAATPLPYRFPGFVGCRAHTRTYASSDRLKRLARWSCSPRTIFSGAPCAGENPFVGCESNRIESNAGEEPHDGVEDVRQAAAEEAAARRYAQPRAGEGHHFAGIPLFLSMFFVFLFVFSTVLSPAHPPQKKVCLSPWDTHRRKLRVGNFSTAVEQTCTTHG